MNKKTGDEKPLWLQEFDTGLAGGWQDDERLMYAQCKVCDRAVWRSSVNGDIEWTHYNPPQFHKPQYPQPCFAAEPDPGTVIGEQREKPQEPDGIFQKKTDKQPESAEMLLFMLSAQDRFLFGEMFKRLQAGLTPGEASLFKRMLISMKAQHVINEGGQEMSGDDNPFVPDPSGTTEKAKATQRKEDAQRPKEKDNPEGVIPPAEKKPKK